MLQVNQHPHQQHRAERLEFLHLIMQQATNVQQSNKFPHYLKCVNQCKPSKHVPRAQYTDSKSIIRDSRIPLSTTLANSMEASRGGPGSNDWSAKGANSVDVVIVPLLGISVWSSN